MKLRKIYGLSHLNKKVPKKYCQICQKIKNFENRAYKFLIKLDNTKNVLTNFFNEIFGKHFDNFPKKEIMKNVFTS